jgi:hypothetical protein
MKNNILYSGDKKKAIPNMKPNFKKMQFDPFYFTQLLEDKEK